jgi:SpoIIAA-like
VPGQKEQFMIEHKLDTANSILYLRPTAAFEKGDFVQLATSVDPFIEKAGSLNGVIIDAPAFPGWESLAAMAEHFRFVRDHQRHIKRIALVTDSALGNVAEHLASHFVSAEIKHFPAGDIEAARQWVFSRT